jgi:hypothetical protein
MNRFRNKTKISGLKLVAARFFLHPNLSNAIAIRTAVCSHFAVHELMIVKLKQELPKIFSSSIINLH